MLLTCEQALRVRNVLDDWLPARIRDSKVVMYPLLRLVFGRRFRVFGDFKQQGFWLSADQFSDVYGSTAGLQKVQGGTDLNEECVRAITDAVVGATVLYAGCGRGHLVDVLSSRGGPVVGCDIVLDQALTDRDGVRFVEGSVEDLPFPDDAFDTVVSTHTLEHVGGGRCSAGVLAGGSR